jgi:hypothetical protein
MAEVHSGCAGEPVGNSRDKTTDCSDAAVCTNKFVCEV